MKWRLMVSLNFRLIRMALADSGPHRQTMERRQPHIFYNKGTTKEVEFKALFTHNLFEVILVPNIFFNMREIVLQKKSCKNAIKFIHFFNIEKKENKRNIR